MSSSDQVERTSQSTPSRSRSSGNLLRSSRGSAHENENSRVRRQSEGAPLGADDIDDSVVDIGMLSPENINQIGIFGLTPFAGHTEARGLSERSEAFQARCGRPNDVVPDRDKATYVNWSTLTWFLLFGWWFALPYAMCGILTYVFARKQGKRLLRRALYVAWPFGRYIERKFHSQQSSGQSGTSAVLSPASSRASTPRSSRIVTSPHAAAEISLGGGSADPLLQLGGESASDAGVGFRYQAGPSSSSMRKSFCKNIGLFFWYVLVAPPLSLLHLAVAAICVFTVVLLPMAKMNMILLTCLWESPLKVRVGRVEPKDKNRHVVHCTFSAGSVQFFKYSVGGANIFILNMLVVVLAVAIIPYFLPHESLRTPTASVSFIITALSTIVPLGYLIVQAIASISAQTNFALGAVLNAFFGTIIEVILYAGAMNRPDTGSELVCQGIVGALLCALVMIPGLCMIIGGIRHKEQKFNRVSAGVSSLLLFVALIGVFTPTLFQRVYGGYELKCDSCYNSSTPASSLLAKAPVAPGRHSSVGTEAVVFSGVNCRGCSYLPTAVIDDPNFKDNTWPLTILVAVFLPAIYVIGLIFTLRTHSSLVDHEEEALSRARLLPSQDGDSDARDASEGASHDGGHHKSDWSIKFSLFVLISCTSVFAIISENINELLGIALKNLNISPAFAGMTIIAWVPSAAEIVNAIVFAWRNEISLAIEIGMSATVQIALIQLPALILLQVVLGANGVWPQYLFQPIFSTMDIMSVALSVLIINFLSMDGKTNYFKGFILMYDPCPHVKVFVLMLPFSPQNHLHHHSCG
jgi:Ca2+:H+ antiporter